MDWEEVTLEEMQILKVFFDLLDEVGYHWAFAVGKSAREWVVCLYKKNGKWSEYIVQNGQRFDYPVKEKSLYNLCLSHLKSIGGNNYSEVQYLVSAFEKEAQLPHNNKKK